MGTTTDSTSAPSATSTTPASSSSKAQSQSSSSNVADHRYSYDEAKLEELRKESPWKSDPKYFQSVSVSPTAIVKMVSEGSWLGPIDYFNLQSKILISNGLFCLFLTFHNKNNIVTF